jgi:hypothetical protein
MAKALVTGAMFFKAEDPERLVRSYEEALGLAPHGPTNTGIWGVSLSPHELPRNVCVDSQRMR